MTDFWSNYGMNRNPFRNTIFDSDTPFQSTDYKKAQYALKFTAENTGIGCVFGDIGTGVSYTAYRFKKELKPTSFTVKYVKVFHISPRDFYKEVCRSLDLSLSEKSRQSMITGIQERATQLKEQGHPLILILDNAQNIPDLAFNDLPCLVSEDYNRANRMTVLLCGTKDLKYRMASSSNPNWEQEIVTHYTFERLSRQETVSYVEHRLKSAGGNLDLISPDSVNALYSLCREGYCKDINNIMAEAFLVAFMNKRNVIDLDILVAAAEHRKL